MLGKNYRRPPGCLPDQNHGILLPRLAGRIMLAARWSGSASRACWRACICVSESSSVTVVFAWQGFMGLYEIQGRCILVAVNHKKGSGEIPSPFCLRRFQALEFNLEFERAYYTRMLPCPEPNRCMEDLRQGLHSTEESGLL